MSESIPPSMPIAAHHDGDAFARDVLATPRLIFERIGPPLIALALLFVGGTIGYFALGLAHGRGWTLLDCAFMTVISLSTVGYGEIVPLDFPAAKLYTMGLLVVGMGVTVWGVSAVTAFIVEGHLGFFFREKALEKHIEALQGHTIICGLHRTSEHVIREHDVAKRPFVVVDARADVVHGLRDRRGDVPAVVGDATTDDVLKRAGISRAAALVCCLPGDKDNLFLLVAARQLRPDLTIVVECEEEASVAKFKAAGATHVINPAFIGGLRVASQVLRPSTVAFLDTMLRAPGEARVTEIEVEAGSDVAGRTLREAKLPERSGLVVVGMKKRGREGFLYSPGPDEIAEPGAVLIFIGEAARVDKARALCRRRS